MNKLLLYAVTACITLVMPMKVNAAEAYAALSNNNTTLTFYYDDQKSSRNGMDIGPFWQKVDGNNVEDNREWKDYKRQISTIIFDDSFAHYSDLQSTAYWFERFSKLTSIIGINNLKTSNVTDMNGMFAFCSSLTSIDVSNFDTRNVENMTKMFDGCVSLTSLDVSNFDTRNVENMTCMFSNCKSMQSFNLSNFDTRNVEDMTGMFVNCYALEAIDLSSFNTEKVTSMYSMFEDCFSLAKINVSSFNTSNVTNMRKMFDGCKALKMLDLSSFNTSNVTNMRSMFKENSALTTVYVSDKWSTAKVEEGEGVFWECYSIVGENGTVWDDNHTDYTYAHIDGGPSNPGYLTLKTGDIPDINTDKVEAYAALSNDNTTLTFYYDNRKSSRNGMNIGPFEKAKDREWNDYRETISTVVFDNSFQQYNDLTSTSLWFEYFRNLTDIKGIENLKTSNVTNMSGMFDECFSLPSLDLGTFDTKNVKDMDGMFAGCKVLKSLNVNSFNTENVTTMYSMFEKCEAITSLNVSSFNTSNVTRMTCMFADCYNLSKLDLSSFNTSNVASMSRMFRGNSILTTILVSNEWSTAKVDKGDDMFKECTNLVGGSGTKWDKNHIDNTYAHIDKGASNPGYLTYYKDDVSPKKEGDANGDGTLNDEDIKEVVNYILSNAHDILNMDAADVNGDGVVNVADIVQIVKIIIGTK